MGRFPAPRSILLTGPSVGADSFGTSGGAPLACSLLLPLEDYRMRFDAPHRLLLLTGLLALAACGGSPAPTPLSANQGCSGCHGDSSRAGVALDQAAPPRDARGGTEATLVTVGAHQAHLRGNVACATCHAVPPEGDRTHINGPFATVIFSGNLVGAQGAVVAPWNREAPTCANYCHGASLPGGPRPEPVWTAQGGLGCGACHSDQQTNAVSTGLHALHLRFVAPLGTCAVCHGTGYAAGSVAAPASGTHHDGLVELTPSVGWQAAPCVTGTRSCNSSCHTTVTGCKPWP